MAFVTDADGNKIEIKKPNDKYWDDRATERAVRNYDKADDSYKDLQRIFRMANNSIQAEISKFYDKYGKNIQSPIIKTLDDGSQVQTGTTTKRAVPYYEATKYNRLDSLQKQLDVILAEAAKEQNAYMVTNLRQLAQESYNSFFFDTFQGYGVGYNFDLLDPKMVTQLIRNPVHGLSFSKRVWNNRNLLQTQVNQELTNGLIQGISTRDMSKRLAKRMGSGYKVAERLMRTEITNTYNQATLQGYKDSGIVEQYQYLATLDNRTSEVCQALDMKVFNLDDAVVGLNYPPMHVNCRSTTLSKFDDEEFERIARREDGSTYRVPSDMSYEDWKSGTYTPKKSKKVAFKPKPIEIKTAEDALNYLGNKAIVLDSFKKLSDERIIGVAKAHQDIVSDFPRIDTFIQAYKGSTSKTVAGTYKVEISKNMEFANNQLVMSQNVTKETYLKSVKNMASPKGTTIENVAHHELGHAVVSQMNAERTGVTLNTLTKQSIDNVKDFYNSSKTHKMAKDIVNEAFENMGYTEAWHNKDKYQETIKISRYALTDADETIGEAFADHYANKKNAQPLTKEIMAIIKRRYNGG